MTLALILFCFSNIRAKEKKNDSGELSLSSVKEEEKSSGIEIYLGGGYLLEISHEKGGESYFSGGLLFNIDDYVDVQVGGFVDWINNSSLILQNGQETLSFYGLELGISFFPFGNTFIKPFIGGRLALTLFPDPFARNSLLLGGKIPIANIFNITAHYSFNYATSTQVDQFFSHLFSFYISFNL